MAELLTPENLPNWVPGRILLRSDDLGWNGIGLRSYAYRGQDVEIPAMRDFMLVSYRVGVTPMQRRFDGKWSQATCGPGSVSLLTRSQVSHWHWTEDVDVTHVYLTPDFVSEVAREVAGRAVEDVTLADILRTDDPVMTAAVRAIAAEAAQQALGGALYVDSVARQLVIHLLRKYAAINLRPQDQAGRLTTRQQRTILEFIEANLHAALNLQAMAAEINMGACTFARHFRRSVGLAPHAYLMERRLEQARHLLEKTRTPAKEVASICGFSDQAHLTRLFARRFGSTPAAFRKAVGGPEDTASPPPAGYR